MKLARRHALRFALYLDCAGVSPVFSGPNYRAYRHALSGQLASLPPELRKQGRREGRKRIRESGGLSPAAQHLVPVPTTYPSTASTLSSREKREQKILLWPQDSPRCPVCRMWAGLPKRSWPSREIAEEARSRSGDPGLRVYPCPAQPGFWHLGHASPPSPVGRSVVTSPTSCSSSPACRATCHTGDGGPLFCRLGFHPGLLHAQPPARRHQSCSPGGRALQFVDLAALLRRIFRASFYRYEIK